MLAIVALVTVFHFVGSLIGQLDGRLPHDLVLRLERFALLSFPFLIGTCAYVGRDRIPLSAGVMLLLWVPMPLLAGPTLDASFIAMALAYLALWAKGRALSLTGWATIPMASTFRPSLCSKDSPGSCRA